MFASVRRGIHRQWLKYCQFIWNLSCRPSAACLRLTGTSPCLTLTGTSPCVTRVQSKHWRCPSFIQSSSDSVLFQHDFVIKHGYVRSNSSYRENLDEFSGQANSGNNPSEFPMASKTESSVRSDHDLDTADRAENIALQELVNTNLRNLQKLVKCSDEELASLVASCPYLRNLEVLERVNENVEVLLECLSKKKIKNKTHLYKTVKYVCNVLIFLDTPTLRKFLNYNDNLVELRQNVNGTLTSTGKVDIAYLCELLNMPQEDLEVITTDMTINTVSRLYTPCTLKNKVDFLVWEGLSRTEIAFNLKLLVLPMKDLSVRILDTKAHFQKVSASALYPPTFLSNKRVKTLIYALLGSPKKKFSRSAKQYLDSFEAHRLYEQLQVLMKLGLTKEDIRNNVFILGHEPDVVREAFVRNVGEVDMTTLEGRGMLIELMISDLNYR